MLAGAIAGSLPGSASADTIPDDDLAYARLLVGAELLAADFYGRTIASKRFGADVSRYSKRFPRPLTIDEASDALDAFAS